MKSLLLITVFVLGSLCSFSQVRKSRQSLEFIAESKTIKKATGWAYNNKTGDWIGYKNLICDDPTYQKTPLSVRSGYVPSRYHQSFISLQFKKFQYSGKPYYALMVLKWQGRFEYEAIMEGWYSWKEMFAYVFDSTQFQKLESLDTLVILKTRMGVYSGSSYEKYSDEDILDQIQSIFLGLENFYKRDEEFPVLPVFNNEGKIIRFYIPDWFVGKEKISFSSRYFEVPDNIFQQLLELK